MKSTGFYFRVFLAFCSAVAFFSLLANCTSNNLLNSSSTIKTNPLNWSIRRYPVKCFGLPIRFEESISIDINANNLTLVLLDCSAMDNMGPNEVLVYSYNEKKNTVLLLQTLLSSSDNWVITSFLHIMPTGSVSLPVVGYSSKSVSRINPDISTVLKWKWVGDRFKEISIEPIHLQL